jgi:uncharacterized protein YbcI
MTDDTLRSSEHGGLLSQISTEMVSAMKTYYGKGPVEAKSYMLDDFLLVVMRGGMLPVERTMLEAGRQDVVRAFRQQFENEMAGRLTGKIEQLTGRKVVTYQSQVMFDPDVVVEIFFFDRQAEEKEIRETAEGQLTDRSIGEARDVNP